MRVYCALGSNVTHPFNHLRRGLWQLSKLPHTTLEAVSSFYETTPLVGGPPGQANIINGVVALDTTLTPLQLFSHCMDLENQHGKKRGVFYGPRTLDIDLLWIEDIPPIQKSNLTIPHPRMFERDFVVTPLSDLTGPRLPDGSVAAERLKTAFKTILRSVSFPKGASAMPTQLSDLYKCKKNGEKIAALTAYDAMFANRLSNAGIDVILVGDSLGQVIQGKDSTVPVSMKDMVYHTECVARGNQGAFLIADMPFMSYCTPEQACQNAAALMQAGAQMVKLEGGRVLEPIVTALNAWDIPVCVHLGLRPQSVHMYSGYKVQGKDPNSAQQLLEDAVALEKAGAKLCVLECIPSALAQKISTAVGMPVIGIGAGAEVDGQILVTFDMLGMTPKVGRFVKNFMEASEAGVFGAVEAYIAAVKTKGFPTDEHSYTS